jgi:mRNA-degrading endonuclease RelE of RelBE toxin-antitoxin system
MKKWNMRFTPEASRLLSKLHPENKMQIKQALNELQQNPYTGKNLQEELLGFKSLRLKQYRIIYYINEEENFIQIYHIGHRRDVYEQLRRLLTGLQKTST